jgi:hypothetical protein
MSGVRGRLASLRYQITKAFGSRANGFAWFANLRRRVPQNVKLEVGWLPVSRALKFSTAPFHDGLRHRQGIVRSFPIGGWRGVTPPELWFDLVPGHLTGETQRRVSIARLDLGQGCPPVHGRHPGAAPNCKHRRAIDFPPSHTSHHSSHPETAALDYQFPFLPARGSITHLAVIRRTFISLRSRRSRHAGAGIQSISIARNHFISRRLPCMCQTPLN